jgi:hypothetical protein
MTAVHSPARVDHGEPPSGGTRCASPRVAGPIATPDTGQTLGQRPASGVAHDVGRAARSHTAIESRPASRPTALQSP